MIFRSGATVKTVADDLNLSGHASRNDLQLMFNLLKPKYVIPVQGEYRQLDATKECVLETGIDSDHILMVNKATSFNMRMENSNQLQQSMQVTR